jgi:hypothetical protein
MGSRNRVGIGLSYRPTSAGIIEQSMGARNRVGIGFSYRTARNCFLGIDSWAPSKFKNSGSGYATACNHATSTRQDAAFSPGIFEQSMGSRNRVGIGLPYRPANAGILEQSVGARINREGIGLSHRILELEQSMEARNRVGIGPPGYTALRKWFLGIDSWAPSKFTNSGSDMPLHATSTRQDAAFSPGIFKQSMEARIRVGIGLSYRPAR